MDQKKRNQVYFTYYLLVFNTYNFVGTIEHVWHRSRVVPSFELKSGCAEIGLYRDYILQILFDNMILNYSVENMLFRTCLVTL